MVILKEIEQCKYKAIETSNHHGLEKDLILHLVGNRIGLLVTIECRHVQTYILSLLVENEVVIL